MRRALFPSVYTSAFLSGAYFDLIISKHISVILLIWSEAAMFLASIRT